MVCLLVVIYFFCLSFRYAYEQKLAAEKLKQQQQQSGKADQTNGSTDSKSSNNNSNNNVDFPQLVFEMPSEQPDPEKPICFECGYLVSNQPRGGMYYLFVFFTSANKLPGFLYPFVLLLSISSATINECSILLLSISKRFAIATPIIIFIASALLFPLGLISRECTWVVDNRLFPWCFPLITGVFSFRVRSFNPISVVVCSKRFCLL